MASLIIPDIDEKLQAQLAARAAEHGRTVQEEAREILARAVGPPEDEEENLYLWIRRRVEPLGGIELPEIPREMGREPPDLSE